MDTYAILEIIKGSDKYSKYPDFECKTSIFNLYEAVYKLLLEADEAFAVEKFNAFLKFKIDLCDEWFAEAAEFRLKHKSQNFSYADCIGYTAALHSGMIFLTGDRAFSGMPNVELVR